MPILAKAALSFAGSHWKSILIALAFAALGFKLLAAQADAGHWHKVADNCVAGRLLDRAEVAKKTAEAKAADTAHVIQVERKQTVISTERSQSYESRLSSLRARHDAGRVRRDAAHRTAESGGGHEGVPEVPGSSASPDAAAATSDLAFNCQANSIQLEELQSWVRQQGAASASGVG